MIEQPVEPPAEPLTMQGVALLEAGHAIDAIEVLRQAVAAGESSAPDLLVRAYLDSGSWRACEEWLTPLVEQGELRFAGRLGVALAELGDRERAEDMLRLAIDTGEVTAANDLAVLLRDAGRLSAAMQVLANAAAAGDSQALANIVQLHLEAGNLTAAVRVAEQHADEIRPDTIVALADVRAQQGRLDDAEAYYRRGAELGGLRAHTAYGQFLLTMRGDPDRAEVAFRQAEQHTEPGWAYTLGRFLLDEGRTDEARYYLQVAIDAGDSAAAVALAELDGEDPMDD
jgi:tetratricopeptide (TPR) repeat protein